MWRLKDIINIIYIIYPHNFYVNGQPRIFQLSLSVKINPATSKLWQVQHETDTETGVTFFAKLCTNFVLLNLISFNLLNKFLYAAYQRKEETLIVSNIVSKYKITILRPIFAESVTILHV